MRLFTFVLAAAAVVAGSGLTLESSVTAPAADVPVVQPPAAPTALAPHQAYVDKVRKLRTKIATLELAVAQVAPVTPPSPATGKKQKGKKGKADKNPEVEKAKVALKLQKKKAELAALEQQLVAAGVDVEAEVEKVVDVAQAQLKAKEDLAAAKQAARTMEGELRQAWSAKLAAENRPPHVQPLSPSTAGVIEFTKAKIAKLVAKLEEQRFRLSYLEEKTKAKAAEPGADVA